MVEQASIVTINAAGALPLLNATSDTAARAFQARALGVAIFPTVTCPMTDLVAVREIFK